MKFNSTITQIGKDALEFLENNECNFIILFDNNAPVELSEISILHSVALFNDNIKIGDTLNICNNEYKITAIGDEALHTLKNLGHCTLSFKGGEIPERAGCIMLEGNPIKISHIAIGKQIQIY